MGTALCEIGAIHYEQGELDMAMTYYRRSLDIFEEQVFMYDYRLSSTAELGEE